MPSPKTTVTVRMYYVGFGDAFLVTVKRGTVVWRMLVDCGVHTSSQVRPIGDSVRIIIDDLAAMMPAGTAPTLDVIVATHHHIDHISGFASPAWEEVQVGEVWVPYVENPKDPDGKVLKGELVTAAHRLLGLVSSAETRLAAGDDASREKLEMAGVFAANAEGDDPATDRLLGRNGKRFLNKPKVRFVPDKKASRNIVPTTVPDATAHILGPSRDPLDVKRMKPPKAVSWLHAAAEQDTTAPLGPALFDTIYTVPKESVAELPEELRKRQAALDLGALGNAEELLAAAAILDSSVNNTSVFFVLDVDGTRLVFVGDSQHGAWEHVLNDPQSLALVENPALYKIGHHGSHNSTPKRYVHDHLGREKVAMMPFRKVTRWGDIPKEELLDALGELDTYLLRADAPVVKPGKPKVKKEKDGLWVEVEFTA